MPLPALLRLTISTLAFGLFALHTAPARSATGAEYVDVSGYLQSDADIEAWYTLRRNLKHNFDDICGDTFCEGDYSNIESLRYVCSVNAASGRLGACGWSFAASDEQVEPATGRIGVRHMAWFCASPLTPGTTIASLLAALAGDAPLYAALPSTTTTLYDGLIDCL